MELKAGRFYNIILQCQGFGSQSRAKDVRIFKLDSNESKNYSFDDYKVTHRLIYYDCTCGGIKELTGSIEKDDEEIVFGISNEKKFVIRELSR